MRWSALVLVTLVAPSTGHLRGGDRTGWEQCGILGKAPAHEQKQRIVHGQDMGGLQGLLGSVMAS